MDNVLVDFPSGISKLSQEVINEYESNLDEVPTKDWYLHIIKISIMEIIWLMIEKKMVQMRLKENLSILVQRSFQIGKVFVLIL